MKVINQFHLRFLSVPENVAFARVTLASFAAQLDYTLSELEEIKVAVSEAVTNSIVHGYENESKNFIQLEATLSDEGLEIIVEDYGRGISDIQQAMMPAYSTEEERMGLGFVFMQSFMDRIKVESDIGKGTKVFMAKRLNSLTSISEH